MFAKVIYCLKIWMFQRQFKVTHRLREQTVLQDMSVFIIYIYMKACEMAPGAARERKRENIYFSQPK